MYFKVAFLLKDLFKKTVKSYTNINCSYNNYTSLNKCYNLVFSLWFRHIKCNPYFIFVNLQIK